MAGVGRDVGAHGGNEFISRAAVVVGSEGESVCEQHAHYVDEALIDPAPAVGAFRATVVKRGREFGEDEISEHFIEEGVCEGGGRGVEGVAGGGEEGGTDCHAR
eukprot:CAMPEP_0177668778 /NCGR_PEP_ID=MMETSP0447-20121125/23000_1 /TAXON_ID=0 /ORGANISM="Stygamoeba regulata, Strain BSH-02190019" /LENGTH=103 /DNA_ID=CAMNT_0019175423 /DNA_START=226 /DNA_END=534 /DNA_ORIENTATION=+